MKVKVGQWVRTNYGMIGKLDMRYSATYRGSELLEFHYTVDTIDNPRIKHGVTHENVIKVADTPQKLIEVGDLICGYNGVCFIVDDCCPACVFDRGTLDFDSHEITAIYTPNKDKSQYTLQWRVE